MEPVRPNGPQLNPARMKELSDDEVRTIASGVMLDVRAIGVSRNTLERRYPAVNQDVTTIENEISRRGLHVKSV